MNSRVTVFNGRFDPLTLEQVVDDVFATIDAGARGWLCTVNVSTLMSMRDSPVLQRFVDGARWVVADGQPLVWCARLFGGRLPERVTGIDLLERLCGRAAREGRGVYLLGATGRHLERAKTRLSQRHPELRLAGADGYFLPAEASARAEAVRASGASLLFVGMGTPLQESFIESQWERLGVAVAIGVGGSFDVIAGVRFRAHPWVCKAGLEWASRLVQEPRRLFGRYLVTNTQFCGLVVRAFAERVRHWTMGR